MLLTSIRFGLRAWIGSLSSFLNLRADQVLMAFIATEASLGMYAVAVNGAEVLLFLPASLGLALVPAIAVSDATNRSERTLAVLRMVSLLTLPLVVLAAVLGPTVLPAVFGSAYEGSVAPFLWLLPGTFGFIAITVLSNALLGSGSPGIASLPPFAALVVGIALDLTLIPRYEATGAAIAATVASLAGGTVAFAALSEAVAIRLELGRPAARRRSVASTARRRAPPVTSAMSSRRPLRLLVCAEEAAGVQLLRGTRPELPGSQIVAVLTHLDAAPETVTVASVARAMELQLLRSELVREARFAEWIRDGAIDLLLNVHSLHVAHAEVVRAPVVGSFNLHPGPLPRYAGLSAPSWAIFHGEERHGVTVHWMDPEIDTGPIAYQSLFDLKEADTGLTVSTRCVRLGLPLVLRLLEVAGSSPRSIPAIAQDHEQRTYHGMGPPNDGNVCWAWTASKIDRFVRASDFFPLRSPWGHPTASLGARALGICSVASTGDPSPGAPGTVRVRGGTDVEVATGDEWLRIERLSVDGELVEPGRVLTSGDVLEDGRLRGA